MIGLVAAAAATYMAGGTQTAVPQLAHLFVITAAVTSGPLAGLIAGTGAGLLLGPAMPLDVADGMAQSPQGWLLRWGVFVLVGVGTGILSRGIREVDASFRAALDDLPAAVVVVTDTPTQTVVTYTNAAAVSLVGDVTGLPVSDVFTARGARTASGREASERDVLTGATGLTDVASPARLQIRDVRGIERTVELHALRAANGQIITIIEEVTTRTRFEETRRHLITLAGHHFRTPLTPIVGFSGLIKEHAQATGDERLRGYAQVLERNANRLHVLLERITELAQLEAAPAHQYRDVGVRDLVVAVEERIDATVPVEVDIPADTTAHIVPVHIERALAEVLANAVTHGSAPVRIDAHSENGSVHVRIHDEGPGLPTDIDENEVFEPYAGVHRDPETAAPYGQGLGLPLARASCQASRSSLRWDRQAASFILTLPKGSDPAD